MNIRLRLTLWYTAVFSLILFLFSVAVYAGLTKSLLNTIDQHLQREASKLIGNLAPLADDDESHDDDDESHDDDDESRDDDDDHRQQTDSGPLTNNAFRLTYTPEEGVYWRILTAAGDPLIDPSQFSGQAAALPTDLQVVSLQNSTLSDGTPIRLYTVPFEITGRLSGVVQVAESYRNLQEVQQQLIILLLIGLPLTMLAASAGGWFLAANALAPIDRITRTAQSISVHDLHQRLNLQHPNDEVGRLAATFDQMLDRLETAFQQQRRFIADASHEMKTPLTILKGDIDVALARERTPDYYRRTLERINDTTDRLTVLVREMLILARSDNRQLALKLTHFDLRPLLQDLVTDFTPSATQKSITLSYRGPDALLITADRDKLHRLFLNLMDNAIKYSDDGDSVTVTLSTEAGQARVTVADTGPGIAPEHLPHLFDRFYRIDSARSRADVSSNSSGAGLGLSIVDWLAQVHHGDIRVESILNQGSTFIVTLPLQPPPTEETA